MEEYLNKSIEPWILVRRDKPNNLEFIISAISCPFDAYKDKNLAEDDTLACLQNLYNNKLIDYFFTEPRYGNEAEIRNVALKPLIDSKCDYVILVDADEIYTIDQIISIFQFVLKEQFICWFKLSLKNYIFDDKHYLSEPFQPPRIFRVKHGVTNLDSFYHDNEPNYKLKDELFSFKSFTNKVIPVNVAFISHYTWLNNEKSKNKCEYQAKRWGKHMCSYEWDKQNNCLKYNLDYYNRFNIPLPTVVEEK